MKNKDSLLKCGRIFLFISAALYTLLAIWVLTLFILSGGNQFMLEDFGGGWIMLTVRYPNVAEDFLHTVIGGLITSLGFGFFSLVILKFAFKNRERWAWFTMWFLPLAILEDLHYALIKQSGFEYLFGGMVVLAVLGLCISFRSLFPQKEK